MSRFSGSCLVRAAVHVLLLRPFLKLFSGVNIVGKENLRQLDRYMIIANHNSHVDILLLFHLLPVRHIVLTHPVADRSYFSRSRLVFRLVEFLFQPIWIERGNVEAQGDPLAEIEGRIVSGRNVILFPEGTRGRPGEMEPFKSGIGRLAARHPDLPIVPVFLAGPERVLPKASFLPLPFWSTVVVGPPQRCRGTHRDITRSLEGVLAELMRSDCAHRHRREPRQEIPAPAFAVLGIDGSGKSTVSREVAKRLSGSASVCLVSDGLEYYRDGDLQEIQPLLTDTIRRFISSRAKKARSLKRYKIPKLAELFLRNHLLQEVRRWYRPDLIVMDGCPLLNMVAWAVLYGQDAFHQETCSKAIRFFTAQGGRPERNDPIFSEFPELKMLARLKLDRLSMPDAVVFLDVPAALACARIDARGERKQVHETQEKLARLREAYLMVCGVIRGEQGVPAATVGADRSLDEVTGDAFAYLSGCLRGADGRAG